MQENNRLRRSGLSYLAQLSYTAVTLAIAIFATPRLIKWLGNEQLGTVRTAADWAGYLSLAELGLGGAMYALLSGALHSGKPNQLRNSMAACFRAYCWVAIGTLTFGALLILIIPHLVLRGSAAPSLVNAIRWATALNVIASALIFFSPVRAIWEVDQRGYVVSIILIFQSVVTTGTALLLAHGGYGIVGQSVASLLGLVTLFATLIIFTIRAYPWVLEWSRAENIDEHLNTLRNLNWPTLALNLANRVSFLSDNLVIAYFFGPAIVVPFFVTQRLVQLAQSQLYTVGNVTWAGLVQLRQVDGLNAFNRRLLEISRLIILLGVVILVPIFAYDEAFVGRWVGGQQFGGKGIVLLAAVNAMLFSIPSFWGWVFNGTGLVAKLVPVSLVGAFINVVVSIVATFILGRWNSRLGMLGPLIGTATANVTCYAWWMPLLLNRHFGTSLRSIVIALGRPLIIGAPSAVMLGIFARVFPPHGWLALGFEMSSAAFLLFILCACFGINAEERRMWWARLQSQLPASIKV